jgi:hypothetical protein
MLQANAALYAKFLKAAVELLVRNICGKQAAEPKWI